jgi:monoamine oxidase
MVEGYNAAPLERASEKALSTAGEGRATDDGRAQFRVLSGYDRVAGFLLRRAQRAGCRIRRSAVVLAIRWRRGRVDVETAAGGRYRARRAVPALPAGVLKARPGERGAVAFDPDPSRIRRALEGIEMGDVVRLAMRFREAFWRESVGEAAFVHASGPFQTLWTAAPLEAPMLTLWAGGSSATALRERGMRAAIDAAGRELAGLFGTSRARVRGLIAGVHVHDWTRDPFSRGAYSYQAVGGASAPRRLARPVEDTLFFAGEATSSDESGTVPGAIASGRRAAKQALR